MLSKANLIIAISESTKNDLIQIYNIPAEKIEVTYLAASINKSQASINQEENLPEKYILFVGNRDFYKNFNNFILSVALRYKTENPIMLTSDNGLQIKAKGLGVTTITLKEFLNQRKY